MANILIICDPDPERRARYLESVQPRLAPVDGLVSGSCTDGDFAVIWALSPRAPFAQSRDQKGGAIVWGLPADGRKLVEAEAVRQAWAPDVQKLEPFDGFFAAVTWAAGGEVLVGTDIMGMFPVYYYLHEEILLAGSSPELFPFHPLFRARFNPAGLVGILLTNNFINGGTFWKNVHRLGPGNALLWRPGRTPVEKPCYRQPFGSTHYELTFSEQLALIDKAMEQALSVQFDSSGRGSVLLSGGLDSRTVAAYLVRNGIRTEALTLGAPEDFEMRCARAAAKQLGVVHHGKPISEHDYAHYAELQTTWQHGANGFNCIWCWELYKQLRPMPARVASGLVLDVLLGGVYPKRPGIKFNFDSMFNQVNTWGFPVDYLCRLLRRDVFGDLPVQILQEVKARYESYAEYHTRRTLRFKLEHRQRFHVGGLAWQMSFGAWPVLPALDRTLMAIVGGLPPATLSDRRGQEELLCRYFPDLAAVPLDYNSFRTRALRPRPADVARDYLKARLDPVLSWWEKRPWNARVEHRHYYRIFNLNRPGWNAVRRMAEPHRDCLAEYFDMDLLNRLLPPPGADIVLRDGISDASGIKNILGFMLWLAHQETRCVEAMTPDRGAGEMVPAQV